MTFAFAMSALLSVFVVAFPLFLGHLSEECDCRAARCSNMVVFVQVNLGHNPVNQQVLTPCVEEDRLEGVHRFW